MYKLTGVTKDYQKGRGTVAALRGVDLVIEDGEWLAIQGRPGTASPRCCRCSAAWTGPPAGIVDFDGHDLAAAAREPGHQGAGRSRSASSSRPST